MTTENLYAPDNWLRPGGGSRYLQLHRHISESIAAGILSAGEQLPAERELAELASISRVTVRKAISMLADDGLIEQKAGAGSFVRDAAPKLKQSLATLISFTENLEARGLNSNSKVLSCGLFTPSSEEMLALGVSGSDQVARVNRLRRADASPIALEYSSLPADILPNPGKVTTSLYRILLENGAAPTRAMQRVSAVNASANDAKMLGLREGTAVLAIDRTGYLPSGRPIEFSRGLYRTDLYDFVSEIREERR